jgi:adenylate cyclase
MAGIERESAMEGMTTEVENLQIAWRYWVEARDLEQLQKMVNSLWLLYDSRGWYQATVELTTDLLRLLSTTPASPEQLEQEIMLQTSLARALMAIKGYTEEVEQAYTRALELSEGHGEIPQLFPVLRGLSSYYMYRAEFDKGVKIGERILKLAESRDDDFLRVHGYLVLGANTGFLKGNLAGLEILDQGIALFEREKQSFRPFQLGNNPGIVCYTTSAFMLWWLGLSDQAVEKANRALELVTELKHPFTEAYTLFHTGNLHMWLGEIDIVMERAKAMLELALDHGFQIWESLAKMLLGAAQTGMGNPEEGLQNVEDGFSLYQGLKSPPMFYPSIMGIRAITYAQAGQPAEGLNILDGLLSNVDEERLLRELSYLLLIKGDLLIAVSPENMAESADIYRRILASQWNKDMKMLSLQAATRLCRLDLMAGNADESGQTLAEIYDSFTEGFDTFDLQEAKAVLDAWRG